MSVPRGPIELGRYSIGMGDRFAHQGQAQLAACVQAQARGVTIEPVWNKSNREHGITGSVPASVRVEADAATRALGWTAPYFVDADHITLATVDGFLESSDFFTLDVSESIGASVPAGDIDAFLARHPELIGRYEIDGVGAVFDVDPGTAAHAASTYLASVRQAGRIYARILAAKGAGTFVTEVSMDETDTPQTGFELLLILAALADEGVPAQTIAPRFSGRFNKGVDYVGSVEGFAREFAADLAVLAHARRRYALPANLKLSVHSGSDKFSIYQPIREALRRAGAGVHLKTAGTTWLEELIGLAEAGPEGLALARQIYAEAYAHLDELCAPYAAVIDIDRTRLPEPGVVAGWSAEQYTNALRHDQSNAGFNADLRQLLHVGYKIAARLGARYTEMLDECAEAIARNVTTNLYERHVVPLFLES
jgi:hypothetical protein